MAKIRIDMFEVQLGAAILLQFETDDGTVRVLADAGVGRGYPADHVLNKLLPILDKAGERRIDLIIGTHYDEDHLKGLVPVIEDTSISIGEAWMPPVANDTLVYALDQVLRAKDLLPVQFYGDGADAHLQDYLFAKWRDCETLRTLEGRENTAFNVEKGFAAFVEPPAALFDGDVDYFRAQRPESDQDEDDHGVTDIVAEPEVERLIANTRKTFGGEFGFVGPTLTTQFKLAQLLRAEEPEVGVVQARSLANIRGSAASDAINAKSLHAVVQALAARGIPTRSEIIEDGNPRSYRWEPGRKRFIATDAQREGLIFKLLGPSQSLVRKHRDKLPVAEASKVALSFRGEIKNITPSNQLSYVGRFGFERQGILVAGDAGCVDFSNGRNSYFPDLLGAMLPLHVIQVAHHAGQNAHFYRVLMAAKFAEQTDPSLMLLSHAYHDPTRPSPTFEDFLLSTLREGDDVQLLFTSQPTADKVADYLEAIHPPVGPVANVGDIQLGFDGQSWTVDRHAIKM